MTDTLTIDAAPAEAVTAPGCGCCQPHPPSDVAEELRVLQARQESVERRLAALTEGGRS